MSRAPASASTPSRTWSKHDILVPARLSGTKAPPPWTVEDLGRLRKMWREGVPVDDIAKQLGRTPSAVTVRASLLGLPRRARGLGTGKWAPSGLLPAGRCFEDDPRAATEIDRLPAPVRSDVTAALMGDPASHTYPRT